MNPAERREWMAHVCGLCLALRRDHGQLARLTTNYDAALLSVLYDAQADRAMPRIGHVCLLRSGLRADVVSDGQAGARYAASICALIGSTKIADHVADGEGWPRFLPSLSGGLAARWARQACRSAGTLGFNTELIEAETRRQAIVERHERADFGFFSRPTELAVGVAFGHTAVLANRPANVAALEQAGQMYGRIMYLLDSYRDYASDVASKRFNALARCFAAPEIQIQASQVFRQAHASLVQAFEGLALERPALLRKLLVQRLRQIGEQTIGDAPAEAALTAGALTKVGRKRGRKPSDDGSCCHGLGDCAHCCDGCDCCCACHHCDCNCCDGNCCDCGGCDCNCC
jgi:hypothetical protein